MATSAAKRTATYDDVLAAPEHQVAELLSGVLYTQPRPSAPHARAASLLGAELCMPFDRGKGGPGGWIIIFEPELHLSADILVPDLAGWRRQHLAEVPDAPYFSLAPDFVCEVLSPRTAFSDRRCKLPIYANQGVSHIWFVDPTLRSIEIFRLDGKEYRLIAVHGHDEVARLEPFDAVEIELGMLWVKQNTNATAE